MSAANLIAKIPPFVKDRKGKIIALLFFVMLVVLSVWFYGKINRVFVGNVSISVKSVGYCSDTCKVSFVFSPEKGTRIVRNKLDGSVGKHMQDYEQTYGLCVWTQSDPDSTFVKTCNVYVDGYAMDSSRQVTVTEIKGNSSQFHYGKIDRKGNWRNENGVVAGYSTTESTVAEDGNVIYRRVSFVEGRQHMSARSWSSFYNIPLSLCNPEDVFSLRNIGVSCWRIDVEPLEAKHVSFYFDYNTVMDFIRVFPQPDRITMSELIYSSPEKVQEIYNSGISIYAESPTLRGKQEMRSFVLATLIGFFFSVIIDLFYRIFSDLRKQD